MNTAIDPSRSNTCEPSFIDWVAILKTNVASREQLNVSRPFRFNLVVQLVLASGILLSSDKYLAADEMSRIKSDERVIFFPTAAQWSEDHQSWLVPIHGWIFEPEHDDALRGAMVGEVRDALELEPSEPATRIFDERIRLFLVDNERGKRIGIQIAGEKHVLNASSADGHFAAMIRLAAASDEPFMNDGVLRYEAITSPTDRRTFHGVSHGLRPHGISVISDVDDTIKVTEVLDKKKMIHNTFFREFRAVNGMSAAYSRWAEAGAQFHFISASPWQLYEPLSAFMQQAGFPRATVHLKRFRLKDSSFVKLFEDPIKYKLSAIESLLQAFPKRTFILVGDSGEKDPEVYGIVARRYPSQVRRIYIRDVTGEPSNGPRFQEAFRGLSTDAWQLFRDPAKLQGIGEE